MKKFHQLLAILTLTLLSGCNLLYPDFSTDVDAMQSCRDLHDNTASLYANTDSAIRQVVDTIEDPARKAYWTEKLDSNAQKVRENDANVQKILEQYQTLIMSRGQDIDWRDLYGKLKNKLESLKK